MLARLAFVILAVFCFASVSNAQVVSDSNLIVTSYVTGLNGPTQIRFFGPNDLFITEKDAGRVIHSNGGVNTTVLDLNVSNLSERGLLGLTLDPNFASNNRVYVYYSATTGADGGDWQDNRLARFTWNGTTLTQDASFTPVIFGSAADGQAQGPNHDGGPILFGPDGKLYGVLGDLNRNAAEQNNQSLAGSSSFVGGIFRLNADGSVPTDNPFVTSTNPSFQRLYAYGVRNSFGMAFDPLTGSLWDTENGPQSYDEINLVAAGFNSGWTQIMGPDARDPEGEGNLVNLPGSAYSDPEFSFRAPVGVTGLTFLANSGLDAVGYRNAVLAGDINNGNLYLLRLNDARNGFTLDGDLADLVADSETERNTVQFGRGFAGVTDLQVGPDGGVYVTSFGAGTIYRISAVPEPSTLALLVVGGACVTFLRSARRRRVIKNATRQ